MYIYIYEGGFIYIYTYMHTCTACPSNCCFRSSRSASSFNNCASIRLIVRFSLLDKLRDAAHDSHPDPGVH